MLNKGIRPMTCIDRVLRLHVLRLAVAAFVIAPGASALAADCALWNVAGTHGLVQSNIASGEMTLQQDGTQFKGQIGILNKHRPGEADSYYDQTRGDIVGTVVGNKFEATVYWADSKVGVYSGQIGPQGLVVGRTFNKNNPAENADFHGSPAFDCLTASAPNGAGNNAGNGNSAKPAVALGRTNAPAPASPHVSQMPGTAGQPLSARNQQLLGPKITDDAAFFLRPSIAQPREGGSYPPQTPLSVRVVPAKGAKDTAYRIEFQLLKNTIIWTEFATLDTPAAVAQSPQGYRGWGAKQDASKWWMTAAPGSYRLRVSTSAPQAGQPGEWVLFSIAGQPGKQGDGDAAQSAPQPLAPKTSPAALTATPLDASRSKAAAVLLNPQSLSPKTLSAAPAATSLDPARNKVGPVLLNPQPLPPGGLQQAPSSFR
jgi:hypothetical protein